MGETTPSDRDNDHGGRLVMFCILDIETTGLDPIEDMILEIGAVLVDYDLRRFDHIQPFHKVCRWAGDPNQLDPVVTEMHTKNGLFNECADHKVAVSLSRALLDFEVWCEENFTAREDEPVYATGNNIKFDISFLGQQKFLFPGFHYRTVDISSIKVLCNEWAPEVNHMYSKPVAQKLHRSIPDCYDSLAELNYYKDMLWTPKSVPQDKC